jgi:hypothetical protein
MSTKAVFLDIEKAFESPWRPGLLYKLSEFQFSPSLIKLINSFPSNRKFSVMAEGHQSMPQDIQEGGAPTLYGLYINDSPQTPGA